MLLFVLKDDLLLSVEVPCTVFVLGRGTTLSCPYRFNYILDVALSPPSVEENLDDIRKRVEPCLCFFTNNSTEPLP